MEENEKQVKIIEPEEREQVKYFSKENIEYLLTELGRRIELARIGE